MTDEEQEMRLAVGLMRHALRLLDNLETQTYAAPLLQHAVDRLIEEQPALRDTELKPETACLIAEIPLPSMAV